MKDWIYASRDDKRVLYLDARLAVSDRFPRETITTRDGSEHGDREVKERTTPRGLKIRICEWKTFVVSGNKDGIVQAQIG